MHLLCSRVWVRHCGEQSGDCLCLVKPAGDGGGTVTEQTELIISDYVSPRTMRDRESGVTGDVRSGKAPKVNIGAEA